MADYVLPAMSTGSYAQMSKTETGKRAVFALLTSCILLSAQSA